MYMRIAGIILLILGILMFVFNGFNVVQEKKVVDIGPLQVDKKENKHFGWPAYTGGGIAIIGVVLIVAGAKTKS